MLRYVRFGMWGLVAVAALLAAGLLTKVIPLPKPTPTSVITGVADIGGPFRLTTHKGETLTDADLRGKPYLLFFGFTSCPDICPTTLAALTNLYEKLGSDAEKLPTLFVTVDPERDTQEVLASYMQSFDPRFIALRGSAAEMEQVLKVYRAVARKVPLERGSYTMDHNAIVYMMDQNNRFVGSLDPHESEDIQLHKVRRLLTAAATDKMKVLKTSGCACCDAWIEYMTKHGFTIDAENLAMGELMQRKLAAGLKPDLTACHTGLVAGYVIEGHVPAREVRRLLAERPDAVGLTVPDMPLGSPGMEADRTEPYDVLLVRRDGSTQPFASYPSATP